MAGQRDSKERPLLSGEASSASPATFLLPVRRLATLCRDVYRWKFPEAGGRESRDVVTLLVSHRGTDAQCAVVRGVGGIVGGGQATTALNVVAFRGTESLRDARVDLDARRVCVSASPGAGLQAVPDGELGWRCRLGVCACPKVHRGFWRQYVSLRRDVLAEVTSGEGEGGEAGSGGGGGGSSSSGCSWWFTGHSLGGALAVIAATDVALRASALPSETPSPPLSVGCVTFGAPRAGDAAFAAVAARILPADRCVRVVHAGDAVPTLPLAWRFRHVRDPIRVPVPAPAPPSLPVRWFRFARDLAGAALGGFLARDGGDRRHAHSVAGYVDAVGGEEEGGAAAV